MPRVRRWVGGAVLIVVLVGLALLLRPAPVRVEMGKVERGRFVQVVEEDGRTRVRERYAVNATLTGFLERSRVAEGDTVDVGTLLATIRPLAPPLLDARMRQELEARMGAAEAARSSAEAVVATAESAWRFARAEAERARTLEQQGAMARRDRENAELALQTATRSLEAARADAHRAVHELQQARAALLGGGGTREPRERWELLSPVRGRVLKVLHQSEGFVPAGEPLFELGDPGRLEVVVDVLTADAVRIHPGNEVELVQWGGEKVLQGRVRLEEPSAVTKVSALGVEEQRVDVLIELTSPPEEWRELGDGYRVEARILVHQAEDVVKVPASALFREGESWAAFVAMDGRARKQAVQVAASNGLEAVVHSGLAPGDTVILYPGDRVHDGVRVAVRSTSSPSAGQAPSPAGRGEREGGLEGQ
ncbi:efflux RND transporter periplasmic adaptor subunit [Hyalangium gracile]|uniref:efflux RND transporter periplasmic adaptor subunit n=1 Tax=Hyalangium gracile TaxID=394092 RepID=UPI001CCC6540|nr:HlyD family efflux transporter periplasmic adaptor subunit [Hyalangium gracile]